ncbi:MAG: U32 family peptidase [Christensenellaceae bacterium]
MNKIELLAPAGNMECLKTAFHFGADAAYMSGKNYGLRAFANNFSEDELQEAVLYAHALNKKIYVTVNSVLFNNDIPPLKEYLLYLANIGADAVIVSDPAVLYTIKEYQIDIPVHLSTQANTTNYLAVKFWESQGVHRVVMSREVTLEDISYICKNTDVEIEAFIHGSMCVAHSGRCLLSSTLTHRSSNKGACSQPCRWEYYLSEKGYDGQYFNIMEDNKGTYIMNSRDLMMIEYVPQLIEAGIKSFKVEGRMKSPYYVASVINAYRNAIDSYYKNGDAYVFDTRLKDELIKSATRGFCEGFFFGNPMEKGQDTKRDIDLRRYTFAAIVIGCENDGTITVEQRNKFCVGDTLEVLSPSIINAEFVVKEICNVKNNEMQDCAPHPQQIIRINCPFSLAEGDILRRHDERG